MDDAPAAAPSQQPVDLPKTSVPYDLGAIDVRGKLVVIKPAPEMNQATMQKTVTALGQVLAPAGPLAVVCLTHGTEITALSDEDLQRMGLRRMTEHEIAMRDDKSSNGG